MRKQACEGIHRYKLCMIQFYKILYPQAESSKIILAARKHDLWTCDTEQDYNIQMLWTTDLKL